MKRGSFIITTETFLWAARLVFLIVISFSIFFVVNSHAHREISIEEFEMDTLITRLIYSSSCFAYEDVRKYPGIIDSKKFTNETLEKCLVREGVVVRLVLTDLDGNEIDNVFKNKDEFIMLEPLCQFKEYKCVNRQKYVLIYDGNLKEGILMISMVMK